ncbi:class I SAM-dependent methyltransferase [Flavicella sediminum]|uniref:class I SAM-dependent methyltransferase n=1 Tax=Flavicella sediminum TaxID=2585141 RepID=UPI001122047C|nr:class I SAM-dependent methyltransferase [Flavicella sediminum]
MTTKTVNTPPKESTFETYVSCQDHLVSGEKFNLLLDDNLDLLMTSPKPKEEDLGKYYESEAYISHTDAKKSLVDVAYQLVKNYTLKKKLKLINSFNTERVKVLDLGCGTGDFLKICSDNKWEVSGVEPNEKARALALSKCTNSTASFFETIEDLKKEENVFLSFDIITMWHVLEHVPNLDETIFNLKKLLKPEGVLIIAVPNFKSFDADYYKQFWAAYDVPRHLWHFSQTAIRRLFFFQSMEVVKTLPMKFDSFYVSLLSEKHKNKKNNFLKAFWIGLRSNLKAKKTKEYSSLIYIIKNTKNWLQ